MLCVVSCHCMSVVCVESLYGRVTDAASRLLYCERLSVPSDGVFPRHRQVSPSPHLLLREHVSHVLPNARLMHELLLYERYKREVHAHRNRRLFDRTRAARRLEEENRELKRQVRQAPKSDWPGDGVLKLLFAMV